MGSVVAQVLHVLSQVWHTPLPLITKPRLHEHELGLEPASAAFVLQLVQPFAFEFEQVLQLTWHPVTTQFPVVVSCEKPVAHVHWPLSCKLAFDLHEVHPVGVVLEQVKQELSQVIELHAPVAAL